MVVVMGRQTLLVVVILIVSTHGVKYKAPLLDENNEVAPEGDESGSGEVDFGVGLIATEADPADIPGNDVKDVAHETQVQRKSSVPLTLILAPTLAAVVILAAIVIFIALIRRRNRKKAELERPEEHITAISNHYCDVTYSVQIDRNHTPNGIESFKKE